jgi:predicted transcriptional regulator
MSSEVATCRADDDVAAVEQELDKRKVQQLPVVTAEGKLVGLVTRSAIKRAGQEPVEAALPPRTSDESETREPAAETR